LVPDRKPLADGFPVLAWSHPFTGVARRCAPSLQRNLVNGPFLTMYGKLGYAVVAPDYTGLGANGRNAVMDVESNANDVIYAVAAARTAVPQLGRRWLVLGESMGAAAALAVAEQESKIQDSGFLGSVAIGDIAGLQASSVTQSSRTAALFVYAVKTIYPDFPVREVLSDQGLAMYDHIEESCDNADLESQPAASALRPRWESHASVKQFLERNQPGKIKAGGPLFVLGYEDSARSAASAHTVDQLCQRGDRVEYRQYAVSPGTLLGSTVRDQMAWIQDRFAGRPAPSTCH
jgi:alpha-beta hydrolase superfamily lysophospholipase